MASAPSRHHGGDLEYYEHHSDPDHVDGNEEEEDNEDDDDFIDRPRPDTPPPSSSNALKRKATEPQQQYPPYGTGRQPPPTASSSSGFPSTSSNVNGGYGASEPAPKKLRPESLEPSILCVEPLDEFVLEIADWVHRVAQGKTNIEVSRSFCRLWRDELRVVTNQAAVWYFLLRWKPKSAR